MYHPLNVFFSLKGYWKHIWGTQMVWGNMTRKGVQSAKPAAPKPAAPVAQHALEEKKTDA